MYNSNEQKLSHGELINAVRSILSNIYQSTKSSLDKQKYIILTHIPSFRKYYSPVPEDLEEQLTDENLETLFSSDLELTEDTHDIKYIRGVKDLQKHIGCTFNVNRFQGLIQDYYECED